MSADSGREDVKGWVTRGIAGATLVFLVLPQFILLIESFTADNHLTFPPSRYGLRWYGYILTDPDWVGALVRSMVVASVVTPLTVLIGLAAAFALDRGPRRGRRAIYTLLIAPMILPHVVLGLGQFQIAFWTHMQDTLAAYTLAHLTIALPYAIIIIGASLQVFDRRVEEAAQSLGAVPWRAVVYVTLPALSPSLIATAIFAFITSFDEFIITYLLSTRQVTIPIQIFNSLSFQLEPSVAAISGLTLIVTAALSGILIARGQLPGAPQAMR